MTPVPDFDLVLLGDAVIVLPGRVTDFLCVAAAADGRRRCRQLVHNQNGGWTDVHEGTATAFNLGKAPADVQARWHAQHCMFHHARPTVKDFCPVEWKTFTP